MTDDFVPLSVQDYSKEASETDRQSDTHSLNFALLGLFGEVGSLLAEVKKKQRGDSIAYRAYAAGNYPPSCAGMQIVIHTMDESR
tara:strand:+ start:356 stop:610 length:255 start_codon:yes stop_codon:yes gene_type:complete